MVEYDEIGYAVVEQDRIMPMDLNAGRVISCHPSTADGLTDAAKQLMNLRKSGARVSFAKLTTHGLRRPDNEESRVINRITGQ